MSLFQNNRIKGSGRTFYVLALPLYVVLVFLFWNKGFAGINNPTPRPASPFVITRSFTVAGSHSFTVPKGVTSMTIEAWGGGGRGGSRTTGADGTAGGGGGAYSREILNVVPGESFNIQVGAGSNSNAAHGGDSWVSTGLSAEAFVLAKGGKTVPSNGITGGEGGQASEGIGATKYSGGRGADRFNFTTSGGGGSSGGYNADGDTGFQNNGGTAPAGGGNGGNGRTSPGSGAAGQIPGGGGGGAVRSTSGSPGGGNGGRGQVLITYTFTVEAGEDQSQCQNAFFQVSTTTPPTGFTTQWSVVSGTAYIFASAEKSTSVHVPAGSSATLRITVSDGVTSGTDEVVLTNSSACFPSCISSENINGDLENDGTANAFNLSFQGTPATLIDNLNTPLGWSEKYQGNVPNTSSFTGAYYLNGKAYSGNNSIYLAGNGLGVSGWGNSETEICGKKYKISFYAAAYTNAASQANSPFVMRFEATGTLVNPYRIEHFVTAPASLSWANLNWQRYSFEVTIPSSMYEQSNFSIITQSNVNGLLIDDFCMEEVIPGAEAFAGQDVFNCVHSFDLSANQPDAQHQGVWTVSSGNALIQNPSSPQTTATITSGDVAKLQWTVTSTNPQNIITLIDPERDGGFELGNSFGANGWNVNNEFFNRWAVGSNTAPTSGESCAYVSQLGGSAGYYTFLDQTIHFFKDVIIHPEASDILLSFKWKGMGESGKDRLLVYTAPVGFTPVGGSPASPSTNMAGATLVSNINLHSSSNFQTSWISLPDHLSGTSVRLIFTWQNDDTGGTLPAAVIDEISLTHKVPVCTHSDDVVLSFTTSNFAISPDTICAGGTAVLVATGCNNGTLEWENGTTTNSAQFSTNVTTSFSATCTPEIPSNSLLNPDFESTTDLQFWNSTGTTQITTSAQHVFQGTKAVMVNGTSGHSTISQSLDVIPGERYVLKVWAKSVHTNKNPKIQYAIYNSGWVNEVTSPGVKKVISDIYTEYTMDWVIPPDGAHLNISAETDGGILYIDQWSLYRYVDCEATAFGEVFVRPDPPAPGISGVTQPTCIVPTGTIVLGGLPATENWTVTLFPGGVNYFGMGSGLVISGLAPNTTYYVRMTNQLGCNSMISAPIHILPIPTNPVISGDILVCVGSVGHVQPSVSGIWTSSNPAIANISNTGTVNGILPGTITLTYTRITDGCFSSLAFNVYENPAQPFTGTLTNPTCTHPFGALELESLPSSGDWHLTRFPDEIIYNGTGTSFTADSLPPDGTYNFVVVDDKGCSSLPSADIVVQPIPENPVLGVDSFNCTGTTAYITPGQHGTWSSSDNQIATVLNNGTVNGISPGMTTLTYTRNSDGCQNSKIWTVHDNPSVPSVVQLISPTCIHPYGKVVIENLPDSGLWTIDILPGSEIVQDSGSTYTIDSLSPDRKYVISVTNIFGCISLKTDSFYILPIPADPVLSGDISVCLGGNTRVYPDSAGIWSSLNPTIATVTPDGLVTGVGSGTGTLLYTRDADGCQSSKSFEVFARPGAPSVQTITQPTCIQPTGSVLLSNLPVPGTWKIIRYPDNVEFTGSGISYTATGLLPDSTYTFSVSDINGCISLASANVVVMPVPSDPVIAGDTLVCVGGQAQLTPSSLGVWTSQDNNLATITPSGLVTGVASGNVSLTYTRNIDGCDATIIFPVFDNPSAPLIGEVIHPTCVVPSGSVRLNGLPSTGNWTITGSPGNLTYPGTGDSIQISNLLPDDHYIFEVRDFRGCSSVSSQNIFIEPIPSDPVITGDSLVCINSTIQLSPMSGGTWTSSNLSVATINLNGLVTGLAASDAIMTFTRLVDGCSSDFHITVLPLPLPPSVGTVIQPTCTTPTGSVTLSGLPENGDWTIYRNPGDTIYTGSGGEIIISELTPGQSFTFLLANQFGCTSKASAVVSIQNIPTNPVISVPEGVCEGSAFLLGTQAQITWTSSDENIATVTPSGWVTTLMAGEVAFTFTRLSDGCSTTDTMIVYPTPETDLVAPEVCQNGELVITNTPLTGTAPFNYLWTGPNGFTTQNQHVVRPNAGLFMNGMYYIQFTDVHGCIGYDSISVQVNHNPEYTVNITDVTMFNGVDGVIQLTPSAGTAPYTFLWSNGSTEQDLSGITHGLYTVTITDAKGCIVVSQPEFSVGHPADCSGFRTQTQAGWGTESSGDNTGTYRNNHFNNAFPSGLTIGCNNTLTLTSASAVEVYLPCGEALNILPTGQFTDTVCMDNTFSGQLIALTLSNTFDQYDPDFSVTNQLLKDLKITQGPFFAMTVEQLLDAANEVIGGCSTDYDPEDVIQALTNANETYVDGKVTGSFLRCCQVSVSAVGAVTCAGEPTSISALGTNGYQDVTYQWNQGAGSGSDVMVAPMVTTTYTVTVTDVLGCSNTASVNVVVNPKPDITASVSPTCEGTTLQIVPVINSGTPGFFYTWNGPAGFVANTPTVIRPVSDMLMAGSYQVSVSDSKGCSSLTSVDVVILPKPLPPVIDSVIAPLCVPPTGSVQFSGLPDSGLWTLTNLNSGSQTSGNGDTFTLHHLSPDHDYHFIVRDGNGCISDISSEAVVPPLPENPEVGGNTQSCVGGLTYLDPAEDGIWSSENPTIADVSPTGEVQAVNPGQVVLTYTRNRDGCENILEYIVSANPNPPTIDHIIQPTCYEPTGRIELSDLPGTSFWTIIRFPGSFTYQGYGETFAINGLPNDRKYTFRLIDENACLSDTSAEAIVFGMPVNPVLGGLSAICAGGTTQLLPESEGVWSGGDPAIATIEPDGLVTAISAGEVVFTYMRLSDGCLQTKPFTVFENPQKPMIQNITQPTCNIPSGSVTINNLSSSQPWTLLTNPSGQNVSGFGNDTIISGLPPGVSYTIRVRNEKGCISEPSDSVHILMIPADPILSGQDSVCLGLAAEVFPDENGIWASSNNTIATIDAQGKILTQAAGLVTLTYTRTVDGCQNSKSFIVHPNPVAPSVGLVTQPTCITPTGSVMLGNLPGSGNWLLTKIPQDSSITGSGNVFSWTGLLPNANYNFTIENQFGCVSPVSAIAIVADIPQNPVLTGKSFVCLGESANLFPSGEGNWYSSEPAIATIDDNGFVISQSPGTTNLTYVRSSDGCSSVRIFNVFENPLTPVLDSVLQPTCTKPYGTAFLSGLPDAGFWTLTVMPGNTEILRSGTVYERSNIPPDSFIQFFVTDHRGCLSPVSDSLLIESIPENPEVSGDSLLCLGFSTQLQPATEGIWTSSNSTIGTITSTGLVTGVAPGLLSCTFTRNADGCASIHTIEVNSNPATPFIGTVTHPTCIVPTGSVLIENLPLFENWTVRILPKDSTINGSGSSLLITELTPDSNHQFVLESEKSCSSSVSANVYIQPIPMDPVLGGDSLVCLFTEKQMLPSQNGVWSSSDHQKVTITENGVVNGLDEGVVTLMYTRSSDGCYSMKNISVEPLPEIPVADEFIQPTCTTPYGTVTINNLPDDADWRILVQPSNINYFGSESEIVLSNFDADREYTVQVTDQNGCTSASADTFYIMPVPDLPSISGITSVCFGGSSQLQPSSGGVWVSSEPSLIDISSSGFVSSIEPGSAVLTYTRDIDGCSNTINYFVNPNPEATIVGPPVICQGGWGFLEVIGGVIYEWSTGATTQSIFINNSGEYSVTVTNSFGCKDSDQQSVTISSGLTASIDYQGSVCFAPEKELLAVANLGLPPYSYQWTGPSGFTGIDSMVTIGENGNFNLTVTDNAGCTAVTSGFVYQQYDPLIATLQTDVCQGQSVHLQVVSPTAIAYQWSENAGSSNASAVTVIPIFPASEYQVTVTNDVGCTAVATQNIDVKNKANIELLGDSILCIGESTSFSVDLQGFWTSSNPGVAYINAQGVVTAVNEGQVRFLFTSSVENCPSDSSQVITVYRRPQIFLTGTDIICAGQTTQLIPSSGGTWYSSDPNIATIDNHGLVTGMGDGSAFFTFTDTTTSCTSVHSPMVEVQSELNIVLSGPDYVCAGSNISLETNVFGGFWESSSPTVATVNNSGIVTGIQEDTVLITYYYPTASCTYVSTKEIIVLPRPDIYFTGETTLCAGQTSTLFPTTGGSWTVSNAGIATVSSDGTITALQAGNVIFTFTDHTTGCQSLASSVLEVLPNPLTQISGPSKICVGSNSLLTSTAQGVWSALHPAIADISEAGQIMGISPGMADFVFTDTISGCMAEVTDTIGILENPSVDIDFFGSVCLHDQSQLGAIATGGEPGYSYIWQGPSGFFADTENIFISTNGLYTVTVTDNAGCDAVASGNVLERFEPLITGFESVLCEGESTTLIVSANNAVTYLWDANGFFHTGQQVTVFPLVPSETFNVTVTNNQGCSVIASANIIVNPKPLTSWIGPQTICTDDQSNIHPVSQGVWTSTNPGVATISQAGLITGISPGTTQFLYTNSITGCISDSTDIFTVHGPTTINYNGPDEICKNETIQLSPSSNGYWTSSHQNLVSVDVNGLVTGLQPGVSLLTFTNDVGCTTPGVVSMTVNDTPAIILNGNHQICVGTTTQFLPAIGGDWVSLNPEFATIQNDGSVTGISEGAARFLFTLSETGCISDTSQWVIVNDSIEINLLGPDHVCIGQTTQLSPTGGGLWVSNNPQIANISPSGMVTGLSAGSATFSFTSLSVQCFVGNSMPITVRPLPSANLTGPSILCLGDTSQVSSPVEGLWFSSNPAVASVEQNGTVVALQPGFATFTILDTITGCMSYPTQRVTIYPHPIVSVTGLTTICEGNSTNLFPSSGGSWVSTNPSVATVNNNGLVVSHQAGFARFIFTEDGSGCVSQPTDTVFVESYVNTGFVSGDMICEGSSTQLFPASGGSWESQNPDIASVNTSGLVTGLTGGFTRFVFTSDNGCISDPTPWITVHTRPVAFFGGPIMVCQQNQSQVLPASGGTWVSSRPSVATINNQGVINGVSTGNARFVFIDQLTGCRSDSTDIFTVHPLPLLALNGASSICVGQNTNLTPTTGGEWTALTPAVAGININGQVNGLSAGVANFRFTQFSTGCTAEFLNQVTVHSRPVTAFAGESVICTGSTTNVVPGSGGTWTSLDPAVAIINASGVVTGINQGIARLRFIDQATGCAANPNLNVSILSAPSIQLNGPANICIGSQTFLLPSEGGTWFSTNPSVATITNGGIVTAHQAGDVQFYFIQQNSGCQSALSPVVSVYPNASLTLTGPSSLCIGYSSQLQSNVAGVWHSQDVLKATINGSGKITGKGPGTVSFYFIETESGCMTQYTGEPVVISNCVNPDFNVTNVLTPVQGRISTNDLLPMGSHYGIQPVLISKPDGSVDHMQIFSDGRYVFQANMPGQYRYMIQVCLPSMITNCPQFPVTISVVDPNKMNHCIVPNPDLVTTYKNNNLIFPILENDRCINSTSCFLNPDLLTVFVPPVNGTAIYRPDHLMEYIPNNGFIGTDTVVYRICADNDPVNCRIARLVIIVKDTNALPSLSASDDFYFMNKNGTLSEVSVTNNDMSPENRLFIASPQGSQSAQVMIPQGSYFLTSNGLLSFTPVENFTGPVDIIYEICDSEGICVKATAHILVLENLRIRIKAYLESALINNGNARGPDNKPLMRDNLRLNPYDGNNYIPVSDPYTYPQIYFDISANFVHVGEGGTQALRNIPQPEMVFSVSNHNAIVDWVFVELRNIMDSTEILATRSCLIQRDGDVVDLDGISGVEFPGVRLDSCYIVLRHRNHFGVMSKKVSTLPLMDFTSVLTETFDFGTSLQDGYNHAGLAQKRDVIQGFMALWAGDADNNGKLKFVNPEDDQNVMFAEVLFSPTNVSFVANYDFSYGYYQGDFDMNGKIKYDNPDDDKNYLFYQILFHPLNANFISNFNNIIQQVPPAK